MPSIEFNGRRYYVPGVVSRSQVRSSLPGPLPAFHVPILLAGGVDGHPYNAAALAGETPLTFYRLSGTDGDVGAYYGMESDLHQSMRWAKRHGLPFAYTVCLAALTRPSLLVTATGPVSQFTLYTRRYGAPNNWVKVSFTGGVFKITPLKAYAMISAAVSGASTRVYLNGSHPWLTPGLSVTIGSNIVAGVSRTVVETGVEIGASGQRAYWVEFSAAPPALALVNDPIIVVYDTDKAESSPVLTTGQQVIDWVNVTSALRTLWAVKHANFTNALPITVGTDTPLKEISAWGAATAGTSPDVTTADVTAFVALMNASGWAQFAVAEQLLPQTYLLVSGASADHAVMRDYATAERTRGFPISVTSGVRWGDIVIGAGDDTDPTWRAAALNSENYMLCAGGLDRVAAYMSLAPAIWARRVAGGPGHNLTNDELVASERETEWNEIVSGQLTALCRKGVATYKLSTGQTIRYRVSQGLTTLQNNNGLIWNETDGTTWSAHQRDLADFVERVLRIDFEEGAVGADQIDKAAIQGILIRRAQRSLLPPANRYVTEFRITSIALNSAANGWDIGLSVKYPVTSDYFAFNVTILVGE
jgi:hypothetical protein